MLIRGLVAIIVGYVIAAATWIGVVSSVFGQDVPPDNQTTILSLGALAIGAGLGGLLFTLIVGVANSPAIYVTIGLLLVIQGRELWYGSSPAPDWYLITGLVALSLGFLIGASAGAYRMDRR